MSGNFYCHPGKPEKKVREFWIETWNFSISNFLFYFCFSKEIVYFECALHILHNSIKGTVSLGNKLFLNSTHLLDINFYANNNCSKVFILKKSEVSKIHIRRHFPRSAMGWRPLAHVCLWLHVSSCLLSTRWRYIVSINMASIKA